MQVRCSWCTKLIRIRFLYGFVIDNAAFLIIFTIGIHDFFILNLQLRRDTLTSIEIYYVDWATYHLNAIVITLAIRRCPAHLFIRSE